MRPSSVPPALRGRQPRASPGQCIYPTTADLTDIDPVGQMVGCGSSHPAWAELHADPRADRPGGLRHGVLPGPLTTAAHDDQVARPELLADGHPATSRPEQQRPGGAQGDDRHHGVLTLAPTDGVAVPGDRVAAVSVEAQPGGPERLFELRPVVPAELLARGGKTWMWQPVTLVVEAEQPRHVDDALVHLALLRPPRHLLDQVVEQLLGAGEPARQ